MHQHPEAKKKAAQHMRTRPQTPTIRIKSFGVVSGTEGKRKARAHEHTHPPHPPTGASAPQAEPTGGRDENHRRKRAPESTTPRCRIPTRTFQFKAAHLLWAKPLTQATNPAWAWWDSSSGS